MSEPTLEQIADGERIPGGYTIRDEHSVLARELLALRKIVTEDHEDRLNGAGALIDALERATPEPPCQRCASTSHHTCECTELAEARREWYKANARVEQAHAKPEGDCCFYEGNTCMHTDELIERAERAERELAAVAQNARIYLEERDEARRNLVCRTADRDAARERSDAVCASAEKLREALEEITWTSDGYDSLKAGDLRRVAQAALDQAGEPRAHTIA